MSVPFLKGIEANETESTTTNKKVDGDRNIEIKYNHRKRKHADEEDVKEKDAVSSSSKQSSRKQTESKRPRKAQQCTVLLDKTRRRRSKPRNIVSIASVSSPQDDFAKLFSKKMDIITNINVGMNTSIHAICVTNDNLIWVNYSTNHVKLFDSAGNILRSVDLEQSTVFNCCTPNGDLLFTQGYANGARAEVIIVPREGDPRRLADLSSYAKNLCGLLCQEEMIYIVCHGKAPLKYFVIKLDMKGEVKETYRASPKNVNINHIISHYGRLYVMGTNNSSLFPLENDNISTKDKANKVSLWNTYSASACVDNHGNVLIGSKLTIYVMDPSLQRLHKIRTDALGSIRSTAVDHRDQLWIGTYEGNLYAARYLSI